MFKEYLNKEYTVAEWGCGIDYSLEKYIPKRLFGEERTKYIREEKRARSLMTDYAINDCFAVSKVIFKITYLEQDTPKRSNQCDNIPDEDLSVVHVRDESLMGNALTPGTIEQEQTKVHVRDEPSTTSKTEEILGEIASRKDDPVSVRRCDSPTRVQPDEEMQDPSQPIEPSSRRPKLTKKQRRNRMKRLKR